MMKPPFAALYVLVTMLLLASCVREIDFQQDEADRSALVVSGSFTNSFGLQKLRLSRPSTYKDRHFTTVSGARVRVVDDAGSSLDYEEKLTDRDTFYYAYGAGQVGRTYTLEIDFPNGQHYRSRPQIMPEPLPLDTIEVHGEWYYFNTADGIVVREPFAFAYALTKAPAQPKGHYLRWETDATYVFNELPSTIQHQCFINNRLNDQAIAIADLSKYSPGGTVYENVGKRKIDQAFELKIAFSTFQYSIGQEAYEYWSKINKLLGANGTIFDAPPAAVIGNIENTTNPDQPGLGFFEVCSVDTFRIYTLNGQLGEEFLLKNYPYCALRYVNGFPVEIPKECRDCLRWISGSTYELPWWWE